MVAFEGGERYHGNNDYVAGLAARRPWIAPVAYLPAWPPPTEADLEKLYGEGFCGVTLPPLRESDSVAQLAQWPAEMFSEINRRFQVVSITTIADIIPDLASVVAALDETTVLFSHLGVPGRFRTMPNRAEAESAMSALLSLAPLPHVGVKISALNTFSDPAHGYPHQAAQPFLDLLLDRFGHTRLCWGSNFSPSLSWISFAQAVDTPMPSGLSASETADVYANNLLRLLGRPATQSSA